MCQMNVVVVVHFDFAFGVGDCYVFECLIFLI